MKAFVKMYWYPALAAVLVPVMVGALVFGERNGVYFALTIVGLVIWSVGLTLWWTEYRDRNKVLCPKCANDVQRLSALIRQYTGLNIYEPYGPEYEAWRSQARKEANGE